MLLLSHAALRTTLKKGFAKNNVTVRCMLGLFFPFAKHRTMFVCTFITWARKMFRRRTSPYLATSVLSLLRFPPLIVTSLQCWVMAPLPRVTKEGPSTLFLDKFSRPAPSRAWEGERKLPLSRPIRLGACEKGGRRRPPHPAEGGRDGARIWRATKTRKIAFQSAASSSSSSSFLRLFRISEHQSLWREKRGEGERGGNTMQLRRISINRALFLPISFPETDST